jgi:hypothetical protein
MVEMDKHVSGFDFKIEIALRRPDVSMDDAIANKLEQCLGRLHAKQRLGIEKDHEAQIFGQGIFFSH